MKQSFRLGLVVNPYAGIGGAMGLKGSDGETIRTHALSQGAELQANQKTKRALQGLHKVDTHVRVLTASGLMGEQLSRSLNFETKVCYSSHSSQTEAEDSQHALKAILEHKPDLIVFAGGDGTARDVFAVVGQRVPVLGVPAGCKIHSGVFAVTPAGAGRVIEKMIRGESVSLCEGEVRDLDEAMFRQGKVKSKHFGVMLVPNELSYVQSVKMGGIEQEELVLADISDFVRSEIEDVYSVMGSGSTIDFIMQDIGLENTLLGVDVIHEERMIASDVSAAQLETLLNGRESKLIVTLIGGQGHLFGRGNQQLSPKVIRTIGAENILIVATKSKLSSLAGRPIIVDTGDEELDAELCGYRKVITGYNDLVLYPVRSPGLNEDKS